MRDLDDVIERFDRRWYAWADRHATVTFKRVARAGTSGRRVMPRPIRSLSYLMAIGVHNLSAAVLGTGVWGVVTGWPTLLDGGDISPVVLGCLLVLLAGVLRPRLPRLDARQRRLGRDDAPRLFALMDAVARELGTRSPDLVLVGPGNDAWVARYGVRRRVLHIGLELWRSLTPQQRVALMAHELGHFANGDTRNRAVVHSALKTMDAWVRVVSPGHFSGPIAHPVAVVVLIVPLCGALAIHTLLRMATLLDAPREQFLADALAAEVASVEAARGLVETAAHCQQSGYRQRSFGDGSYPPVRLRLELLDGRASSPPRVTFDADGASAVAHELRSPGKRPTADDLIKRYRWRDRRRIREAVRQKEETRRAGTP